MTASTKIDLNVATENELESIEGIGPERARVLVRQRQKLGAFRSWAEVAEAQGFNQMLIERLKTQASLSSPKPTQDLAPREPGDSDPETSDAFPEEEEEVDDPEIDALAAIAQMDLEAALAYEVAAALVSSDDMRQKLLEFGQDHRRHVHDLDQLIRARGEETMIERGGSVSGMFANLASAMGALGTREAIIALVSNEHFTNQTYMAALDAVTDEQARSLLDRNFGDEQRHLRWLTEQRDELRAEDEALEDSTHVRA